MNALTRTSLFFAVAVLVTAGTCQAQVFVHPGHFGYSVPYYHASTAAEGYLRGRATVIRSQGYANQLNSQAAINYTIARRNNIDNSLYGTQAYFNMREMNRQSRAGERGPRQTEEARVRIAKKAAPKGLSPSEFDSVAGEINWPVLLRYDSLGQKRTVLERIFHERADTGAISSEDFMEANDTIKTLMADLKGAITKVPQTQYTEAKQFLQGLAYEAGQPLR